MFFYFILGHCKARDRFQYETYDHAGKYAETGRTTRWRDIPSLLPSTSASLQATFC